jgi:flavin reductase (DIM6/NTAB) family NADH-FMN oxidoreductase RutF
VLDGVASWWVGRVVERIHLGDHTGFVLEPVAGRVGPDRPPFTSDRAADFEPGRPRD